MALRTMVKAATTFLTSANGARSCDRLLPTSARCSYSNYKSEFDLDTLYPNSGEAVTAAASPSSSEDVSWNGVIPHGKITVTYNHSSEPGGMNVNKVKTKAVIRFNVTEADWIPSLVRNKFVRTYCHRITKRGDMVIESERTRYQQLNLSDCYDKLRQALYECAELAAKEHAPPSPEWLKEKLKREEAAARRRLREKRFDAEKKRKRQEY